MWLQHLLTHKLPVLWRLHKVHHADPDLDVSTAIRFHPGEIVFSVFWKIGWVAILGVSAPIFIAFEIWLAANALFNHGNLELPRELDRCSTPFSCHAGHAPCASQRVGAGAAEQLWLCSDFVGSDVRHIPH